MLLSYVSWEDRNEAGVARRACFEVLISSAWPVTLSVDKVPDQGRRLN